MKTATYLTFQKPSTKAKDGERLGKESRWRKGICEEEQPT